MKKFLIILLLMAMCVATLPQIVVVADFDGTYTNEEYGYKLIFPEEWKDYVIVRESGNGDAEICFSGKSVVAKTSPYKDYPLFMVLSQASVTEDRDTLDSIEKLGSAKGINYYHATGTGSAVFLFDMIESGQVEESDMILAQADLEMQQKISRESTNIRFEALDVSVEIEDKNSIFQVPVNLNPIRLDSVLTEFDDYTYLLHNGLLSKYNNSTQSREELLEDVANFITNNEDIYYTSFYEHGIFKFNIEAKLSTKVFDGEVTSIDGCLKDKYLYYYVYSEDGYYEYSTWVLNLETYETQMLLDNATTRFYVTENQLYYTPFRGDITSKNLYVCDLDGSNKKLLISDVCDFAIIDNQLYYASCDFDYGSSKADFHIVKSNMDGSNPTKISDNFKAEYLHLITKDSLFVFRDNDYVQIPYVSQNEITVTIDGEKILFDQPPIIVDDRTLVPLRAIFEKLGATVDWNNATQTVTSTKADTTLSMTIGKPEMCINGAIINLDVVPQLINDRTLVPVRAVAEGFNCTVDWDEDNKTVIITTS